MALHTQDLLKRYEAKDQKCNELRSKFTTTKTALAARERELETAQRLLQKATVEKNQAKVGEDCVLGSRGDKRSAAATNRQLLASRPTARTSRRNQQAC